MACLIIFKRAYIMLHVAHFIGSSCAWCWQCSWLCLIIFVVYRCGSLCGLPVVLHIVASSRVFSLCFICHLFLNIICDCFRSRRAHETIWCRTIIGKKGMPKSNMTSWSSYLALFVSWFHHICNHPWIEFSAPVSSSLCPLDVTHWQDMAVVTRNELCPQVGSQENGPRQMPWGSEPWQIQIGGKNVCWALPCLATLCCRVEVESCFFFQVPSLKIWHDELMVKMLIPNHFPVCWCSSPGWRSMHSSIAGADCKSPSSRKLCRNVRDVPWNWCVALCHKPKCQTIVSGDAGSRNIPVLYFFGGGVAAAAFVFLCFSPHWRVLFCF